MINKFLTDVNVIKKAIDTKKLVVFAGAGISIDAGVPSWGKLIDELKKDLDLPVYENDYLKIPQIYFNERQEKEYVEKIRNVLEHKKIKHNEIHEEIFELNPEHILTTNFEDLLEQVVNKKTLPFSVIKQDEDLPYSNNTKLLVKIHGDLGSTNFVLKEDDYLNYSKTHPLIEAFINSVFASKVVLFIGYSFSDYNLKQIVQNVRSILGNNFQNAYLLSIDSNVHISHKEYLKNKGVKIINYYDSVYNDKGESINYIESFLKGENIFNERYYKKSEGLSDKGQTLLNFIKFIRYYDEFKIKLTSENVLKQVYNSLDRFSEIKYLPQSFVAKLYPFKTSTKNEHLVRGTFLLLKNPVLQDLFLKHIEIKEKEGVVYLGNDKKEPTKRVEDKLKEVLVRLNNSIIFNVTDTDFYRTNKKNENKKSIIISDLSKCNCSSCKFDKFRFKESIKDIINYSINELSDIGEDLQKAYLNYKIGNFLISYKMFEEVAAKSWVSEKYISYYISKTNMRLLKNLINHNEDDVEEDKKKEINREIEGIDSDKLIFQIPYKSDEEYELLKIIRDDSVLLNVEKKIEEYYLKIEELFDGYKKTGYNSYGVYYPQLLYIELYKLKYFYTRNYIISDVFANFRDIILKSIKSLTLLHFISESYGQRLKCLDEDYFVFSVKYCNPGDLVKFYKKHGFVFGDLTFKEDSIDTIISYSLNFFKSIYDNNSYVDKNDRNELFHSYLSKDYFKNRVANMFGNIILLLHPIKIPEKYQKNFTESILSFLEYENFLYGNSIEYLNSFVSDKSYLFNEEDCKRLISIMNIRKRKYEMYNFLETIAYVITNNKLKLISDKDYILNILNDFDYYDRDKSILVPLWKISDDKVKRVLENRLKDRLKESFNEDLYKGASYDGVIDFNLFFEDYIGGLGSMHINNDGEIYFNKGSYPSFHSFFFYNTLAFIYGMKVKGSDKRLKKFPVSTPLIDFYIFRRKEDVSKFKIEWLLLLNNKIFHEEIARVTGLKKKIAKELKDNFNEEIANIYVKYFL